MPAPTYESRRRATLAHQIDAYRSILGYGVLNRESSALARDQISRLEHEISGLCSHGRPLGTGCPECLAITEMNERRVR